MNLNQLNKAFHEAARKGEIDRMEDYRLQGAKLDSRDENGRTVEEKSNASISTSVREWDDIGRDVVLMSIEREQSARHDVQNYIAQVRPHWTDKAYRFDFSLLR